MACKIWPCLPLQYFSCIFSPSLPTYSKFHLIYSKESNFFLAVCFHIWFSLFLWASQVALVVRNRPVNAGDVRDMGLISGLGRSPRGGNGNPFHYPCLENPMDRGACRAIVHGVTKSWTWLKWLSRHTGAHKPRLEPGFLSWVCMTLWSPLPCQLCFFNLLDVDVPSPCWMLGILT